MGTGPGDICGRRGAGHQRRAGARFAAVIGAGSREGIALVITLILLAVITFMAITFLVVSRSEQGQVHTETDQTTARLGGDSALEYAKIQLLTPMMVFTNEYNLDLLVSTIYVNQFGFVSGVVNPTNVNYEYLGPSHAPLAAGDRLQNIANLLINPRVPVYITNRVTKSNEFSFYYDANRNGRYDTNGWQPVISSDPTRPFYDTNGNLIANIIPGNTASNNFIGDPEWIGGFESPRLPPSGTKRVLFPYAFLVSPGSQTPGWNYIQ